MKNISILGCGWLGFPLAEHLLAQGYTIKGSTTTEDKLTLLRHHGIDAYKISLPDDVSGLDSFLADSDILIIDIPPGKSEIPFSERMEMLIPYIANSGIGKVLFISSTSVYGGVEGIITEETLPLPESANAKEIFMAEQTFMTNNNFKTTVIRFGGLLGGDRHPVKYMSGKENISGGNLPVNLIQREDCINMIIHIVSNNIWGEILNGVAPYHPIKKDFYTAAAIQKNFPLPLFSREEVSGVKVIIADKIMEVFGFQFERSKL